MAEKKTKKKTKDDRNYQTMRIVLAVLCVLLLLLLSFLGYRFGRMLFTNDGRDEEANALTYELTIKEGQGALSIGNDLERNGVIDSGLVFFFQTKLYRCQMEPGTYKVNSGMSSKSIAKFINTVYKNKHEDEGKTK